MVILVWLQQHTWYVCCRKNITERHFLDYIVMTMNKVDGMRAFLLWSEIDCVCCLGLCPLIPSTRDMIDFDMTVSPLYLIRYYTSGIKEAPHSSRYSLAIHSSNSEGRYPAKTAKKVNEKTPNKNGKTVLDIWSMDLASRAFRVVSCCGWKILGLRSHANTDAAALILSVFPSPWRGVLGHGEGDGDAEVVMMGVREGRRYDCDCSSSCCCWWLTLEVVGCLRVSWVGGEKTVVVVEGSSPTTKGVLTSISASFPLVVKLGCKWSKWWLFWWWIEWLGTSLEAGRDEAAEVLCWPWWWRCPWWIFRCR